MTTATASASHPEVRKFCQVLAGIQALLDESDKLGGHQQALRDIQGQIDRQRAHLSAKADELAVCEQAIAEASKTALAVVAQAKVDAEAVIAQAAGETDMIREAAQTAAAEAKKREQFSEAEERLAKKRLEGLLAQATDTEAKLADAQAVIARAEAIKAAMGG